MSTTTPARPTPRDLNDCLTHPRTTVMTTSGLMEYADRGQGPPLLSVHGTPGGCDQGLVATEYFRVNGFRVIAPSRPGYLGTPLSTGRSPEAQADAMAALLDTLDIERVAVLAASGGGPSGYLLAARHPTRVSCLLQIDSICLPNRVHPVLERLSWSRAGVSLMLWLFDRFPARTIKLVLGKPTDLGPEEITRRAQGFLDDPVRMTLLRTLTLTGAGWPSRRDGDENDTAAFAKLAPLPLEAITCPTLIMHGTADTNVPTAHAEHAHAHISGAELYWIRGGSHMGFWIDEGDHAEQHALGWLADHTPR